MNKIVDTIRDPDDWIRPGSKRVQRALKVRMKNATSYADWKTWAAHHDDITGVIDWRRDDVDPNYNAERLGVRYDKLRRLHDRGDADGILHLLDEGLHGNQDGMGSSELYSHSLVGTKFLIEDYIQLLCDSLELIRHSRSIDFEEKLAFFRRANLCYGRSALALSGAAGHIYFHHGVLQALIEADALPSVISGSSAGGWLCCQLGILDDEELREHFLHQRYRIPQTGNTGMDMGELRRFLTSGMRARTEFKNAMVEQFTDPRTTFREAFEKTGRFINISVAPSEQHQRSRILNVITAPNVTLASAARATGSIPGLFEPAQLYTKNRRGRLVKYIPGQLWVDGSVSEDLPFKKLARLYGVNHFIVSMANPMVLPFVNAGPVRKRNSVVASVTSMLTHTAKELSGLMQSAIAPLRWHTLNTLMSQTREVMNQQYIGDINIAMSPRHIRFRRILFSYNSEQEIEDMILAGRRRTWLKLAHIKAATAVSETLHNILEDMDRETSRESHVVGERHRVL